MNFHPGCNMYIRFIENVQKTESGRLTTFSKRSVWERFGGSRWGFFSNNHCAICNDIS